MDHQEQKNSTRLKRGRDGKITGNDEKRAKVSVAPPVPVQTLRGGPVTRSQQVNRLINFVMRGEGTEAQNLINKNPNILLREGIGTDPAGRRFKNITAFQYALWARDWYMWEMMLPHMDTSEAREQYDSLIYPVNEEDYTQFDFDPLKTALKTYIDKHDGWNTNQREQHWRNVVGDAQRQLPMHAVQEYCRTDKTFASPRDFSKGRRGSVFKVSIYSEGSWQEHDFTQSHWFPTGEAQEDGEGNLGWLGASEWDGDEAGISQGLCLCRGGGITNVGGATELNAWRALPEKDLTALRGLSSTREQQFIALGVKLSQAAAPSTISP